MNLPQKMSFKIIIFLGIAALVFSLGVLATSISQRSTEAVILQLPKAKIDNLEIRNSEWGKNYPRQYSSYMDTADSTFVSKHGGSLKRDMLAEDPNLVILWAGYGFSKQYNQGRGHANAVKDINESLRTGAPKTSADGPMPATCWACKSPGVVKLNKMHGAIELYKETWASKGHEMQEHIGCADCHDPETMNLTITRPALLEAFERKGKDISKISHQEMRTLVCAQCHVEYYFKGEDKYLTFPWDNGTSFADMESYYDGANFSDWTHTISKAPMLKAQHPDYELYLTGIHAQRGISCADCHMPYKTEGSQKFTDHKIQSPLNNVANSCQVCHREKEADLMSNVYERQDKFHQVRLILEADLVKARLTRLSSSLGL